MNMTANFASAAGALCAGLLVTHLIDTLHWSTFEAYRLVVLGYAVFGMIKFVTYVLMSSAVEGERNTTTVVRTKGMFEFGLRRPESKSIVFKLSCLFTLDAFAGGFVMQPYIVFWFATRYGLKANLLGTLLMAMNLLAGISALASGKMVKTFGAVKTMVYTHFPSNIFLMLVAFMPNCEWAVIMLLIRFSISQMDVPAREAYVNNSVESDEKAAANGITMLVRNIGVSLAPVLVGYLSENPKSWMFTLPFIISGILKCVYDVTLYFWIPQPVDGAPAHSATGHGVAVVVDEHTPLTSAAAANGATENGSSVSSDTKATSNGKEQQRATDAPASAAPASGAPTVAPSSVAVPLRS